MGRAAGEGAKKAAEKDLDALFAKLPAKRAAAEPAPAPAPKRKAPRPAGAGSDAKERKPRGEAEHFLDNGEKLVAVAAPRRFQDGLPVYKSFDGFSDLKASNTVSYRQGGCVRPQLTLLPSCLPPSSLANAPSTATAAFDFRRDCILTVANERPTWSRAWKRRSAAYDSAAPHCAGCLCCTTRYGLAN